MKAVPGVIVAAFAGLVLGVVSVFGVVQTRTAAQVDPVSEPLVVYGSR